MMSSLPSQYAWLNTIGVLPRMVSEALKLYGTKEVSGPANNPVILDWAKELGTDIKKVYTADSVAWCGLFMALVAKRADKTPVANPLWALNWAKFGNPVTTPGLGDILTFERNGGGHVALYIAEDDAYYHVLGGNQTDQVCITRILKTRLYRARRPIYNVQPSTVKPYKVSPVGVITTNES